MKNKVILNLSNITAPAAVFIRSGRPTAKLPKYYSNFQYFSFPRLISSCCSMDRLHSKRIPFSLFSQFIRFNSTSQSSKEKDNAQNNSGDKKSVQKRQQFPLIKTRQEFVAAAATSFLDSIKLNLKWLLIKQNRPFNADDMSAFISWFVWSNILWFILGTTTFASILLYTFKYLTEDENNETNFIDNLLLKLLFRYDSEKINIHFITKSKKGLNKENEDNIKPSIRDGVITLNNLKIQTNDKDNESLKLDIFIQKMDLTLDFSKWYQGKGLINSVYIYGGNGVIENSVSEISDKYDDDVENYEYDNNEKHKNKFNTAGDKQYLSKIILPAIFNNNSDYEFGQIRVSNFNIIYSAADDDYEEFNLQIFNLDLKKLRLKWFLFDLMKPQICSGTINDALFSIHKKQLQTQSNLQLYYKNNNNNSEQRATEKAKQGIGAVDYTDDDDMNSIIRIQINSINLKTNPLLKRSFNWLVDGKANIICDVNIPSEKHFNINDLINEIASKVDVKFINKNIGQLVKAAKNDLNNVSPFFDYNDLFNFNFGQVVGISDNSESNRKENTATTLVTSSDKYGKNYIFRMASDNKNNKMLDNGIEDRNHLKTSIHNRYIIFDLKIQFVNPIAAVPSRLPYSRTKEANYINYEELKKLVALVNQRATDRSFFAKKSNSALSNFDNSTTKKRHFSYTDMIISNDNSYDDSGEFLGLGDNEDLELIDKQFTLKSSTIFNIDELYMKVSLTGETDILDQCLDDLYDDLVRNLHHEMHAKFRFS